MMTRSRWVRGVAALSTLVLLTLTVAWAAPAQAPSRPPQPFAVFVETSEPEDAALRDQIGEALDVVRDRVRRRGDWFVLADNADSADVVLRITNYRTAQVMQPKIDRQVLNGNIIMVERSEVVEFHYVDALAVVGEVRETLTGLDERDTGPSIRNAASHLAEELERFCKDNYDTLSASR